MQEIDAVVIGAGPAGLTSAIYLVRAGRTVVVLEAAVPGGQVFINHAVENYLGFPDPISGSELAERMEKQAQRFGIEIKQAPVSKITKLEDGFFQVESFSDKFKTKSVIICTGAKPKPLGLMGEEKLFGRGVSYCSTCDGMFFKGKDVVVIGGGNSALHGAEHLSKICNSVTLIHRRNEFRGDRILVNRLDKVQNLKIILNTVPLEFIGDNKLEAIKVMDLETKVNNEIKCDGAFIYVGYEPQNTLLKGLIELDNYGYVPVNQDMSTSLKGLYVAGDLVQKKYRQIITAMSDGCIAGLSVDIYLNSF